MKTTIGKRTFRIRRNPHWLRGFRKSWLNRRRYLDGKRIEAAGAIGRELKLGPFAIQITQPKPKRIKDRSGRIRGG